MDLDHPAGSLRPRIGRQVIGYLELLAQLLLTLQDVSNMVLRHPQLQLPGAFRVGHLHQELPPPDRAADQPITQLPGHHHPVGRGRD